jgi:3-oxoacyl-[acyl-carrier protein] reductase/pteridine reductase
VTRILIDGSFYCANALAPEMVRLGKGAIINVVDLSAWEPFRGYVAHSVGKSALWALTRQLAVELAPGVRVNAIAPGPVLPTPNQTPSEIAGVASRTLLGRWGAADDVSEAVLFLLRSDYITGEVIVVDGGQRYGHL